METRNLETAPKINTYKCLFEGTKELFKNFLFILKMSMPIVHVILAIALMLAPIYMIAEWNFVVASIIVLIVGAVYLIYGFWEYLLGLTAVSYFAKDVFEHKEIKTTADYYSYVRQHSKSYIKYWLYLALIFVLLMFLLVGGFIIANPIQESCLYDIGCFGNLVLSFCFVSFCASVILFPLLFGLNISYLFWAYGDKAKVFNSIKEAVVTSYKKIIPVINCIIFCVIFYTIIFLIMLIPEFICQAKMPTNEGMLISSFVEQIFSLFAMYMLSFIGTRFYFNLIKK